MSEAESRYPPLPPNGNSRVTNNGRVTIPKPIRNALNLDVGDEVTMVLEGREEGIIALYVE